MSVQNGPGRMQLTRTEGPNSSACALVMMLSAFLAAL